MARNAEKALNIELLYLPSYSPNLNSMERFLESYE
ncbi:TPA: transposase [Vibrio mimicus]